MKICEEMIKFRKYLDDKGIEWKDKSTEDFFDDIKYDYTIHRTHFYHNGNLVSVINGQGTYGGVDFDGNNRGLLEVMIGDDEPEGYLSCEQAIEYIFTNK